MQINGKKKVDAHPTLGINTSPKELQTILDLNRSKTSNLAQKLT